MHLTKAMFIIKFFNEKMLHASDRFYVLFSVYIIYNYVNNNYNIFIFSFYIHIFHIYYCMLIDEPNVFKYGDSYANGLISIVLLVSFYSHILVISFAAYMINIKLSYCTLNYCKHCFSVFWKLH